MNAADTPANAVDLSNCDREPIHVPGSIQPHGVLLAFDRDGALSDASLNAAQRLQTPITLDMPLDALLAQRPAVEAGLVAQGLRDLAEGAVTPASIETVLDGQPADLVVHGHADRLILEWETRRHSSDEVASFALKAHRMIDLLRRQRSVDGLLAQAVEQVRQLTGFDRVMAYRFRADESGEVVAESRDDELEPFLGLRYPASDIPAQARRLYTINTLRLIADVGYRPVALAAREGAAPLDLSFSVLRSVSPVHVEYLQNIGVGASMSVSIVIGGRLWGLFACHHRTPLHVPYSVRMACDVLAHMLAATVSGLLAASDAAQAERAAAARTRIMETVMQADDLLAALRLHEAELRASFEADALLFTEHGNLITSGVDETAAAAVLQSLADSADRGLLVRTARSDWPAATQEPIGTWVGLLALPFSPATQGWIVALRREQVEHVRWGGKPEKTYRTGPLGPRLTPRGSHQEWREVVRDTAEPWRGATLAGAEALLAEMRRAVNNRLAETDRMRAQLLAMLGHDLRDPLTSIHLVTSLMKRGMNSTQFEQRISSASSRMQRLIDHVMDLSRLGAGLGLGMQPVENDLCRLVRDAVAEAAQAHPGANYQPILPPKLTALVDADRFGQMLANLLGNAHQHSEPGAAIVVTLDPLDDTAVVEVKNRSKPIDPALVALLFSPFKHQSLGNLRNRRGLGLGLFIAQQIAAGHGGSIGYRYDAPWVVFRVVLPLAAGAAE